MRERFGVDQTVPPPRGVRIDQGNCSIGCETRYFVHVEFREVHKESPKQHRLSGLRTSVNVDLAY